MTDERRLNLPLFALGAVAAHAVVLAALLPMLVTLPGPGKVSRGPLIIDVDVMHAPSSSSDKPEPGALEPTEATSALPVSPAASEPAAAADPMTTQATAPMVDTGQANAPASADAKSAATGPGETQQDARLPDSPPTPITPGTVPPIARAEPPETLPPAKPAASAATEPANPAKVEKPMVKKPAAVRAKPVSPRAPRIAKAKPKASDGDFNSLFSGTMLAPPTAAKDRSATR